MDEEFQRSEQCFHICLPLAFLWFDSPGPLLGVMSLMSFVFADDDYDTGLIQFVSPVSPDWGSTSHNL